MKKFWVVLLICIMCFCDAAPAFAAGGAASEAGRGSQLSASGDGTMKTDMTTGKLLFITLAENTAYRWNANDSAEKNSVIHLDDATGENCNFRLSSVGGGWYGIKHIKSGGTDRYADIDDKSKSSGAKLHLWESSDSKVSGNDHRQFAFYYVGTDSNGNEQYYIKNKNSNLWMGYEDTDKNGKPSCGDKIIQTDSSNRKLWNITPEVVPKSGNEKEDLIALKEGSSSERESGAYCEIFKQGTIESLNRSSDLATDGTTIHFYELGTSSKWRLEWKSQYSAYEIHAVTDGEKDRNSMVWDVDGESGKDSAEIHLWKDQDKSNNENTSQLWRFIKQSDGSYKIQNARSGKYVSWQTDKYSPLGYLTQSGSGKNLEVDVFAGTDDPVNFNYSYDWMKDIPDEALLSSVNLPGSHDTGTASITEDFLAELSFTSCQKYYYGEQLNIGTRSFDVRCNAASGATTPSEVKIIHGSATWQCYDRDDSDLTLQDILDDSVRFLKNHNSETLVMMIKPDDGSVDGLARAVGNFIKNNKDYVYTGGDVPSMGEARGKIVFIRRYAIDTNSYNPESEDGVSLESFGIDLSDWDQYSYGDYKYAVNIYNKDGVSVYAQDAYNEYSSQKQSYIEGTLKQTTGADSAHAIPQDAWIYNYTSCAVGRPLELTRGINPWLFANSFGDDKKTSYIDNRRLGMVMLNFIDRPMARLIYETNTSDGKFFVTKVDAPALNVTYGQTLSDAYEGVEEGDGTWTFEDPDYMPTTEDFQKQTKFKVTFTPKDSRMQSVTKEVSIHSFKTKTVTARIDNKEITYGKPTPELTYTFDESQLVGDDTVEDLGITLTLSEQEDPLPAGTYSVKGSSSSDCYTVKFENEGTVTVNKRTVGIKWSDTRNLVYTGNPVNVTASATGLLAGDTCGAIVEGGNEIGPSWNGTSGTPTKYTATVTGLTGKDAGNYQLPDSGLSVNYYIRRGEPTDVVFPDEAVLTYGQPLSAAELPGASGSGTFKFVNKDGKNLNDKILNAGVYEEGYYLIYIPENTQIQHGKREEIKITVNKKAITAKADEQSKTYGDNTPELTFTVDKAQLVGEDSAEDLKLTLTAGDGDEKTCDAGAYTIRKKECASANYDVTVEEGLLTVSKRVAVLEWKGEKEYTYDGKPAELSVSVENQVKAGDCDAKTVNAARIQAGTYTAAVTGLTSKNYSLPEDKSQMTWKYKILQAEPGAVFPNSAKVTYGQTLAQAEMSGGTGDGEFSFTEADRQLSVSDSGKEQEMTFTPSDSRNYKTATKNVPVTVDPKPLTIATDNKEKTYGDETPELTWSMDESQLVGSDRAAEFDLDLTAGEGDKTDCDVGSYEIKGTITKQNANYDVTIDEGRLKVDPRMAVIQWSSVSNLKVGDPAPSAKIINLVGGDECVPVVESDGTESASWTEGSDKVTVYHAEITKLSGADKFNYTLPEEDVTLEYLVRRADASDYHIPKEAVMTYGQTLSEAVLIQASGDGTFTFVDEQGKSIGDEMPEAAGAFTYKVKFTPSDPNVKPVTGDVKVTVRPKRVTVQAENSEKTYGEKTVLSFSMDESQLVKGDTKADLKLILTAVSQDDDKQSGDKVKSPAGTYTIEKKRCKNANYNVTVTPATLWIHKKEVGIRWSDVSNLYYTGEPVAVTAAATGVLKGDSVKVKVVNGDRIEPGTYTAVAVELSNENYALPKDKSQLTKKYIIQKASDGNGGSSSQTSDPQNGWHLAILSALAVLAAGIMALLLRKRGN